VSGVRPLDLVVPSLATVVLACTSSGASAPPGFSTAYATASVDGGAPPSFRAVAGSGPSSGLAVGEDGAAALLRGSTWAPVDTGTTATLGGVSMSTGVSALAVELGGARVIGWNGRAWGPMGADRADRAAAATFGLAVDDAWVAGNGIEHWDGQSWTQEVPSGATYTSLSGSFRTDVWAVGPGGIQHYDGKAWSAVSAPSGSGALAGVFVSALWDAWFVGAAGTILHWDGTALTSVASMTTKDLTCVGGTAADDVWAGGKDGTLLHYDGATWTPYATPAGDGHTVYGVWRAFDSDVFIVDDTGTITRYVP
jgi:hypothetical protein